MIQWLRRLTGIESSSTVDAFELRFRAPWASDRPVLVLLVCLAAAAVGVWFYFKLHAEAGLERRPKRRWLLAALRSLLLVLIALVLAEPVLWIAFTKAHKPQILVLIDGTTSMNTRDELPAVAISEFRQVLKGREPGANLDPANMTRLQLLKATMTDGPVRESLDKLRQDFDVRYYLMDALDEARLLETDAANDDEEVSARDLAAIVSANAELTAMGGTLDDLAARHGSQRLAGTIVISDFIQNAGLPALEAATRLNCPVFAIGMGPTESIDLQVILQAPLVLKQNELTSVTAQIKHQGLDGQVVQVQLYKRRLGEATSSLDNLVPVEAPVAATLNQPTVLVPLSIKPDESGRFELVARVEPVTGEVNTENNDGRREVTIKDDSLRLFFVEYEPTWEWRFVKEVFHRDPLIGQEGFRTYLRSADVKVRQTNDLFVDQLVRPRKEFFSYDVILLSDVPANMMTRVFQDRLIEYVEKFGGGLVVIAGPRFGVGSLTRTRIGEILPVVLDETIRPKVAEFRLAHAPIASEFPFMQLGSSPEENRLAWNNLGPIPWYQPVLRAHPLASVLATHPVDRCADHTSFQPLIATRRYGKGEVIYLGFNETWRLRKKYGERFYRQFWGQLIYRLGLGRVLGEQKRFSPYTDRSHYQSGDVVRFTVEAYDGDFEAMSQDRITAQLFLTNKSGQDVFLQDIELPLARDDYIFEASTTVHEPGRYRLLVDDPVTNEKFELSFEVLSVSRESARVIRDVALQRELANQSGGKSGELYQLPEILDSIKAAGTQEPAEMQLPLWNTWLVVILLLLLLHFEWLFRKLFNLR